MKFYAMLLHTLCVARCAACPNLLDQESRFVNDSLHPSRRFKLAVSTERNVVVASASASISYRRSDFEGTESGQVWSNLRKEYTITASRDNETCISLNSACNEDVCGLLYLSVLSTGFGGFRVQAKNKQAGPVIVDIMIRDASQKEIGELSVLHTSHPFYGVLLAIAAACLVGTSFIFQKKALLKTEIRKARASFIHDGSCGEFAYLGECVWWCGMLSMATGEILNFVAYSIAPAILITPLGALRVIVSAVLSSIFLNERLNTLGKIGVFLSLVGSVMVIIHAPRHEKVKTFQQFVNHFTDLTFLIYCLILVAITLFLVASVAPRYGRTNALVYVSVCNIIGALCVLCGKGLGISLKDIGQLGEHVYLHPVFWVLVLTNVVGIVAQIVYLNKSLAHFDTSVIIPIRYVFTNVFLIFGSILLFQEFAYMSVEDIIGMGCGFATVVVGVVLLNRFKGSQTQGKGSSVGYL